MRPFRSTRKPSNKPAVDSAKTSPPDSFIPPASTVKRRIWRGPFSLCVAPVSAPSRDFSSGEKAMPFGRTQALAVAFFRNDGNRAVDLGSGHAPRQVFARHQPALIVDGIAVRIVGALAKDRDFARGFDQPHHAIVRNVRPDEIASRREP